MFVRTGLTTLLLSAFNDLSDRHKKKFDDDRPIEVRSIYVLICVDRR